MVRSPFFQNRIACVFASRHLIRSILICLLFSKPVTGDDAESACQKSVSDLNESLDSSSIRLVVPGFRAGRAWTASSFFTSPRNDLASSTSVEPKLQTKEKKRRNKARRNSREEKSHQFGASGITAAAPVSLLAWNLPSDIGIPSHKVVSRGEIGIDTDGSMDLTNGWVQFSESSERVLKGIQAFEQFSLFADVTPCDCKQFGPARILSCSVDTNQRNFTLGQEGDVFVFRIRSCLRDSNGTDHEVRFGKVTPGQRQQISVQYDDCQLVCSVDGTPATNQETHVDFSTWQRFPVVAGNEVTGDRPWSGHVHGLLLLPSVDSCSVTCD